jgi:hypothetical protein
LRTSDKDVFGLLQWLQREKRVTPLLKKYVGVRQYIGTTMSGKAYNPPPKPPPKSQGIFGRFLKFFDSFLPQTPYRKDRIRMRLGIAYAFFAWNAVGAIVWYHYRTGTTHEELKKLHYASKDDLTDSPG